LLETKLLVKEKRLNTDFICCGNSFGLLRTCYAQEKNKIELVVVVVVVVVVVSVVSVV